MPEEVNRGRGILMNACFSLAVLPTFLIYPLFHSIHLPCHITCFKNGLLFIQGAFQPARRTLYHDVVVDLQTHSWLFSKAFGGNYPGQRPPAHKPYTPNGAAFEGGEAKAHFIQYGGGNALVLANGPNPTSIQPQQAVSNGKPEFIAGTLFIALIMCLTR